MTIKIKDLASRLRKRIVLEQPLSQADGAGGLTLSWQEFATIWAEILPRRASENLFAGQLENRASHKIMLRYLAGIDTKMRIKFGTRYFNIISILNVEERNKMLEISVEEVVK